MLIPIKDSNGNVIMELDEKRFPLLMEVETKYGDKVYKINVNYVKDEEHRPTKTIRSVNMS